MKPKALIVWGGWDGHAPSIFAELFAGYLRSDGFEVEISDTLDAFLDAEKLADLSLIVPMWTMGTITREQLNPVIEAVRDHGVGIAGCHRGMGDSFRNETDWQFMVGGQWVAHPGNDGVKYTVNINRNNPHEITAGLDDFEVCSEQYFMHVDPGANVLAITQFPTPGVEGPHDQNPCAMPQIWTKMFGKGRVFYSALGHQPDVYEDETVAEIMRRGMRWAARRTS